MEEAQKLLEQMHDIEMPANTGLPVAPGWILLTLLCACLIGYFIWRSRRNPQSQHVDRNWRPQASLELQQIRQRVQAGDTADVLADCSRLARRVTIAIAQRSDVAALTGQAWLQKLDELSASRFFTQGDGRLLESAPYQKTPETNQQQLQHILDAVGELIDSHREGKV